MWSYKNLKVYGRALDLAEIINRFGYLVEGEKAKILKELNDIKKMIYGLIKWVLKKDVK